MPREPPPPRWPLNSKRRSRTGTGARISRPGRRCRRNRRTSTMADNPIPLKPKKIEPPEDALDIDSLWLDPKLGDGLVDMHRYNIPMDKPRDYFRVISDPKYR